MYLEQYLLLHLYIYSCVEGSFAGGGPAKVTSRLKQTELFTVDAKTELLQIPRWEANAVASDRLMVGKLDMSIRVHSETFS